MNRILIYILLLIFGLNTGYAEIASYHSDVSEKRVLWENQADKENHKSHIRQELLSVSQKFSYYHSISLSTEGKEIGQNMESSLEGMIEDLKSLLLKHKSSTSKLPVSLQRRVDRDSKILNAQIDRNKELIKSGNLKATNFIVDLRKSTNNAGFLAKDKFDAINKELQEINKSAAQSSGSTTTEKPAFYVLLNMFFPDSDIETIEGKTREEYLKNYTQQLYNKSKLTSNGILLNVESFIRIKDYELIKIRPGEDEKKYSFILSYQPYIGLGSKLKDSSIDRLIQSDLLELSKNPELEFAIRGVSTSRNKPHRAEVLTSYVNAIEKIINDNVTDGFFGDETNSEYFTELTLTPEDKTTLHTALEQLNASPELTADLKDYAGVAPFLQRLVGGHYYSRLSSQVDDGLSFQIITTSYKNTDKGKTAIQLAKEAKAAGLSSKTLLLGIHFTDPEENDDKTIMRYTAAYGSDYDDYVKTELDNIWKDISLLNLRDEVKDIEGESYNRFIGVLSAIDVFVSKIHIPENWWFDGSKWYHMNAGLAGIINGLLDDIVGLVQLGVLVGQGAGSLAHIMFQVHLYVYEVANNEQKKQQLITQLTSIRDNMLGIVRAGALEFIDFFSQVDFSQFDTLTLNSFRFFTNGPTGLTYEEQLERIDAIANLDLANQAEAMKGLIDNFLPFLMAFAADAVILNAVFPLEIVNALGREVGEAMSHPVRAEYYTFYAATQVAVCFIPVAGVVAVIAANASKGVKIGAATYKIFNKIADGVKVFKNSGLNKVDDFLISLENLFNNINKSVDTQALGRLKQRLGRRVTFKNYTHIPKLSDDVLAKLDNITDPDLLAKLDADLADDAFKKAINGQPELVDAWAILKKTEIDGLSGKVDNIESLNKALKQDGYDADYFETLLKSKDDPQKFINDYVSKVGDNGKFVDDVLETDYTSYLARKAREGKTPRDRADWNHTRDYMLNDSPLARGNNFNRKAWENEWYPAWEVQLDNGKFIDGYNPFTKEIVSRKATELVDVSESTFISYLDELVSKYAPPKKITTKKQGAIYDQLRENPDLPLDSKLILEIPESNRTFYDIDRYAQIASDKGITLKFRPE